MTPITALTISLKSLWGRHAVVIATPGLDPDRAVPVTADNPLPVGLHIQCGGVWVAWDGQVGSGLVTPPSGPPVLTSGGVAQLGTDYTTYSQSGSNTFTFDVTGLTPGLTYTVQVGGSWNLDVSYQSGDDFASTGNQGLRTTPFDIFANTGGGHKLRIILSNPLNNQTGQIGTLNIKVVEGYTPSASQGQ